MDWQRYDRLIKSRVQDDSAIVSEHVSSPVECVWPKVSANQLASITNTHTHSRLEVIEKERRQRKTK